LAKPDTTKKGLYLNLKDSKTPAPFKSESSDARAFREKAISIQIVPIEDIIRQSPVPVKK
jgi:hypothetical protein